MANSLLAQWSKAIRDRDGRCMNCGITEGLHAHHILPKSTHPELIFDLSNGKALCYVCHKAEHERNRLPRLRGDMKPQRRSLLRQIGWLEEENKELKRINKELNSKVAHCRRGSCDAALDLLKKMQWQQSV
jgi:5-methylcytosine-specific restriction endonuclease McrA